MFSTLKITRCLDSAEIRTHESDPSDRQVSGENEFNFAGTCWFAEEDSARSAVRPSTDVGVLAMLQCCCLHGSVLAK